MDSTVAVFAGAQSPAYSLVPSYAIHPLVRAAVQRLGLTPRESSLTELLAAGCPTDTASATLRISKATIRTHLRKIFSCLQVTSRVELVAMVLASVAADIDVRQQ